MQYMLLIFETPGDLAQRTGPAAERYWGAYTAYGKALREAGVLVGGAGLQPPTTATTVRLRDGKREVQDGPFADSKEQLGGYYTIDVPDLDKALEWAARCPAAPTGVVEVRPLLPPMQPTPG